jgi:hypothetical protein
MMIFPVLKILQVISFISWAGLNLILTAEYLSGSKETLKMSLYCFEPVSHLHEVDVVVETEVRVDHDNSEGITGRYYFPYPKKS